MDTSKSPEATPADQSPSHQFRTMARAFAGLLLVLLLPACATVRVKDTTSTFRTVVIDAGHGGGDTGTTSKYCTEKAAALDVARKLNVKLRAAGYNTVMTRSTDTFIELNERARISNRQHNAIFVSIHFNEAGRRAVCGAEVYYKSAPSCRLACNVLDSVCSHAKCARRGVKTANFRVLRLNEYPAVLVECGYLSNRNEARRCASENYRDTLADAIADGVMRTRSSR